MPSGNSDDFTEAIVYASNALAKGWSTAKTLAAMLLRFVGLSTVSRAAALSTAQAGVQFNQGPQTIELFDVPELPEIQDSPVASTGFVRVKIIVTFPQGPDDEDQIRQRIFDIPETDWPESLYPEIQKWIAEKLRDSSRLNNTELEPKIQIGYVFRGE